jgi:pyruvate dehydrogenase (quinone)
MPPKNTPEGATGFSFSAIRSVISGRGDELIDLARTSLWR